jgi:hypothetical protein
VIISPDPSNKDGDDENAVDKGHYGAGTILNINIALSVRIVTQGK